MATSSSRTMPFKLELIAAVCENMGIGKNGGLPWSLKSEMAFFTRMTTDTKDRTRRNVVIMGRRTWDSIPERFKPLKGRENVVLTSSKSRIPANAAMSCTSLSDALEDIAEMQHRIERVWVIGGSKVYKDAMESPHFGRLYLTRIKKSFDCDTFFPPIPSDFALVEDLTMPQGVQEENGIKFVYEVYERRQDSDAS